MVTKMGKRYHKLNKLFQFCDATGQKKEVNISDPYSIDKDFDPS